MLSVKQLRVSFTLPDKSVMRAVQGIDFSMEDGELLAIVGESGSGKSVTALALTQLLPQSTPCEVWGKVCIEDSGNILEFSEKQMQSVRGSKIAYIFQDPSTALNPVLTAGYQIAEAVRRHQPGQNPKKCTFSLLRRVGIRDLERCYKAYPFELSGGMQQRVMIAIALACRPKILVADEPTTALDVSLQKRIMDLLKNIQVQEKLSIILITHNLGLVKNFAHRTLVMLHGKIVEQGPTEALLRHPQHPYTRALIQCVPSLKYPCNRLTTIETELAATLPD